MTIQPKPHPLDEYIESICRYVFQEERARLSPIALDLIQRNAEASGTPHGFICNGRVVSTLSTKELRNRMPRPVAAELHDEALFYVESATRLEQDQKKLRMYAGSIFRRCHDLTDVRNLLPDMIASVHPLFSGIPRTLPLDSLLQENAMLKVPFQGFQNIIGYYLANRLIF